jgi:hypothetical protein
MAFNITTAFVQQYKGNVLHLAQQKGSRFRDKLRVEDVTGKNTAFERLAPSSAIKRTTRHTDTPLVDLDHTRRWAFPADYDWADLIDNLDKVKLLISPESEYAINGSRSMNRTIDDVIIAALTSAVASGADGTATTAYDTANQQIADGTADMTLSKLLQTQEKFNAAEVDDEDRYFAIGSYQLRSLLEDVDQIRNSDYAAVKALVHGQIDTFLGFTFVRTERLAKSGDIRSCVAWQKNAMGMALGKDVTVEITRRADKNYATQVYYCLSIGAARIEDVGVVEILCDETK